MTFNTYDKELQKTIIAADNGDPEACDKILSLFENGLNEETFAELRKNTYLPLANSGDPHAMYIIGQITSDNKDVSYKWYLEAAQFGYTPAMLAIGLGYTNTINSNHPETAYGYNNEMAKLWFMKALNQGDSEGARLYAELCCENNPREHEEYLIKAIRMNNWKALVNYGDFFYLAPENYDNRYNERAKDIYIEATRCCTERKYLSTYGEVCKTLGYIFGAKVMYYPAETEVDIKNGANAIKWLCCAHYADEENKDCLDLACTIANNCNIKEFDDDYYIRICEMLDNKFNN